MWKMTSCEFDVRTSSGSGILQRDLKIELDQLYKKNIEICFHFKIIVEKKMRNQIFLKIAR